MPAQDGSRRILLRGRELLATGTLRYGGARGIRPICPTCGELWARVEFGTPLGEYIIARWPCFAHGTPYFCGGSLLKLLYWWDSGLEPSFPACAKSLTAEYLLLEAALHAFQILGEIPPPDLLDWPAFANPSFQRRFDN